MNRVPKWLHNQTVGQAAARVFLGAPTKAVILPTRAERALALRSLLLFGAKEAGDVQSPEWLRQLAGVSMGGISTAAPRVNALEPSRIRQGAMPLESGSLVVTHNPKSGKGSIAHCEARIIEQLWREPVDLLEELSPLVFYSVLFPCSTCTDAIGQVRATLLHSVPENASCLTEPVCVSQFALERPRVRIELSYEDVWRCDEDEIVTSKDFLRASGLEFDSIRDIVVSASEAGAPAHLMPTRGGAPPSRRKPRATTPEEIAEIRAQRAAKRALRDAQQSPDTKSDHASATAGIASEATAASNYNARQWMQHQARERTKSD